MILNIYIGTGGNFDISNVSKQDTVYPTTTGATVAPNGKHICFLLFLMTMIVIPK